MNFPHLPPHVPFSASAGITDAGFVQGERRPRRTELEVLLDRLSRRHFHLQAFRPDQHGPDVLAAVREWGDCADVAIMFSEERALAYRVPTATDVDVYAPERVLWWYAHKSVWTLRALLTLAPPGHPDAPSIPTPAPVGLGIPREARTPVDKPPSGP